MVEFVWLIIIPVPKSFNIGLEAARINAKPINVDENDIWC